MDIEIPVNKVELNDEILKKENDISKYDKYLENNYKSLFDKESEITDRLKQNTKKDKKKIEVDIILNKFSNNLLEIIEDLVELFNNNTKFDNYINYYVYYMKNIGIIFTKKNRIFYVGILFLIISFLFLFIEVSS